MAANDKWIVIPPQYRDWYAVNAGSYYMHRKYVHWYGTYPVPLTDGNFALPERVVKDIEKFDKELKKIIKEDNTITYCDDELKKLPKVKEEDLDFVEYPDIEPPPNILTE